MTSPQPDAALAVISSYQQSTQALRGQLATYLTSLWKSLGVYRSPKDFLTNALPVISGGQQKMSSLTSGYLSAIRTAQRGGLFAPTPVDPKRVTGATVRNGTTPTEVYERPFHLIWRELHEGVPPDEAIESGLDRAVQSAVTDLQLAKTHTAQEIMAADDNIVGYRRVLEGTESCALCILASSQRYHHGDLLPIHPACDCGIAEIFGDVDPGQVINEPILLAAHDRVQEALGTSDAGGRTPDYRKVLITHQHSELGPVLAIRGQHFLGPNDLNTDKPATG